MCVIVTGSRKPKEQEIVKMAIANPHGFGIAYYEKNGQLIIHKGLYKVDEIVNLFKKATLPYLAHFRLATVGEVNAFYCQPFRVKDNQAFVHNGHIGQYLALSKSAGIEAGKMNDSMVASKLYEAENKKVLLNLAKHDRQKFAALKKSGVGKAGKYHDCDGLIVSNLNWDYRHITYDTDFMTSGNNGNGENKGLSFKGKKVFGNPYKYKTRRSNIYRVNEDGTTTLIN